MTLDNHLDPFTPQRHTQIVEKIAKPDFKARMVVRLAVAGAFHTDFMAPAVEKLSQALAATPMKAPAIPVVSNVDGKPHSDPEVIKAILAKQVTSPVLWENTLTTLLDKGMTESYEIGPGKARAARCGASLPLLPLSRKEGLGSAGHLLPRMRTLGFFPTFTIALTEPRVFPASGHFRNNEAR